MEVDSEAGLRCGAVMCEPCDVSELVMEVDSEAGLRCGACLTVNTLADTEPADTDDYHHDEDMAQLTGNMYVLTHSFTFSLQPGFPTT